LTVIGDHPIGGGQVVGGGGVAVAVSVGADVCEGVPVGSSGARVGEGVTVGSAVFGVFVAGMIVGGKVGGRGDGLLVGVGVTSRASVVGSSTKVKVNAPPMMITEIRAAKIPTENSRWMSMKGYPS
jgi:hypothetical protein